MRLPLRVGAAPMLATAAAILLMAPAQSGGAEARTNLPDIEDEVMCTICGTLLAESESPQADRERALIRRLIAAGQTKEQIEDALVAQYGSRVLATPSGHGFDLAAWIVPLLGLVALGVGLGALAVRRRGRQQARAPVPSLDSSEASRLDEDMSRYEL